MDIDSDHSPIPSNQIVLHELAEVLAQSYLAGAKPLPTCAKRHLIHPPKIHQSCNCGACQNEHCSQHEQGIVITARYLRRCTTAWIRGRPVAFLTFGNQPHVSRNSKQWWIFSVVPLILTMSIFLCSEILEDAALSPTVVRQCRKALREGALSKTAAAFGNWVIAQMTPVVLSKNFIQKAHQSLLFQGGRCDDVTLSMIRKSIQSFSPLFAAGPSGLKPSHLKDSLHNMSAEPVPRVHKTICPYSSSWTTAV